MLEVINLDGSACSGGVSKRKKVGMCHLQWLPGLLEAAFAIYSPSGRVFPKWSFGALVAVRKNSEQEKTEVRPGLAGGPNLPNAAKRRWK